MKEIKRIFKRAHSVECSLAKYSGALSRAALLGPLKMAVVHGLCWLISAMLMFWAALYANEHLAVITVLGNMH
ncbi:hypothetical protein QUB74_29330, partial [Microcoleus sp. A2-C2]|uniref:hypothetical protein n=1 Tax=Microcoleus sp. A2-C2 TaxID=2818530 RepID=UPI002FD43655